MMKTKVWAAITVLACVFMMSNVGNGQATIANDISVNEIYQIQDIHGNILTAPGLSTFTDSVPAGMAYQHGFYFHGAYIDMLPAGKTTMLTSTTGSTLHVRLSTTYNQSKLMTLVASITDQATGSREPLMSIFRDPTGHYWIGKQLDDAYDLPGGASSTNSYLFRLWDPVSPCASKAGTCVTDDVFVNFVPNGQIVLHEIATLAGGTVSWQAGMTNFGLPLSSYAPNTSDPAKGNTPPLTQVFIAPEAVSLINPLQYYNVLAVPAYGIPKQTVWATYAFIDRMTEWSGNLFSSTDLSGLISYWNGSLSPGPQLLAGDVPCNSGVFQKPGPNDNPVITTQYAPKMPFMSTPCGR